MSSAGRAATAALVMTLVAATAWSQPAASPIEQQQRRGVELLQRGQNQQALDLFRELYERTREPRALWRMATAEAAVGRWVEAEAHMRAALGSASDEWIRAQHTGLEQTLRQVQARVGLLTLRCSVPGAVIEVNGHAVTTFPVRVVAGDVPVVVRAEGYQEASMTLSVPGNVEQAFVQDIELRPTGAERRPAAVGTPSATTERVQPAAGTSLMRTLGITSIAVGGAALVTGVVGLILRNSAATQFNDDGCWMDGSSVFGGSRCADSQATTATMQTVSVVGFVLGGALAATGVVLLATAPSSSSAEHAHRTTRGIRLTAGPGAIGLGLGGAW
jgi:hypothetical protein